MRREYLRSGIAYLNKILDAEVDEEIVHLSARKFEQTLLWSLPNQAKLIEQNRRLFLSSKKDVKFSEPVDEFLYVILRNILVSNYLLRDDVGSGASDPSAAELLKSGLLKVKADFSIEQNTAVARLIKSKGSLIYKTKDSLLKNFAEMDNVTQWIERKLEETIRSIFNVKVTTIRQQFKNNSFLQIAPVSPKDQNADHQSDLHVDTFFPAIKWWYFPSDVFEENGPFQYLTTSAAPRSELYEFMRSTLSEHSDEATLSDESRKSHNEGSLRGDVERCERLFRSKLRPVTCSAGTLVIGNVMGLHARGYSKVPEQRLALHGSFRSTIHDQFALRNLFKTFMNIKIS